MSIEPTFRGFIETTQDTLLIFEACRRGMLPKICRRLQEKERKIVQSGSVFVFDERESGIKRWTDGLVWSPSRILGNFLIYRELDKRSPNGKKDAALPPPAPVEPQQTRQRSNSATDMESQAEKNKERALVGSLTNSYRFKRGGLIKKTMSIVVNGVAQHMISYYTKEDVLSSKLKSPSAVTHLAILEISQELLVKQNFRIPPVIEQSFEHGEQGKSEYNKHTNGHHKTSHPARSNSNQIEYPGANARMKTELDSPTSPESYRPPLTSTSYANSPPSPYAPTQNYYPSASGGLPDLPMPSMPPMRYVHRHSFHELPPVSAHVTPRMPHSSQPPMISSIPHHPMPSHPPLPPHNSGDSYYYPPQVGNGTAAPSNWSDYQYPPYHPSHAHGAQHHGSPPANLAPITQTTPSTGSPHSETSGEVYYQPGESPSGAIASITTSQVPLYNTTASSYNDLPTLPELSYSTNSPANAVSNSHAQQSQPSSTTPSPTMPPISAPSGSGSQSSHSSTSSTSSTASTASSTGSSSAPITPPLSTGHTNAAIMGGGGGSGGAGFYNTSPSALTYPSYYTTSTLTKNENYATSMPSNSFMYDPNGMHGMRALDGWDMRM